MMFRYAPVVCAIMLFPLFAVTSCASDGPRIAPAEITLTDVQLDEVSVSGQSLRLQFAVANPNPFPLPVKSIRYQLRIGDRPLARGQTESRFVVAARGDGAFVLGVELDVLDSVSGLGFLLLKQQVEYELHGSLAVDLPFARPMPFASSGQVQLRSGTGDL